MPVKKRLHKGRAHRIIDEAVAAYISGDVPALDRALGLKPWEISPLDVHGGTSPYPPDTGGAISWPLAQDLQRDLRAAVRKAKG